MRHPEQYNTHSRANGKDRKQKRINFLEQIELKRKYFRSSYQTTKREPPPTSSLILVDHNTSAATKTSGKRSVGAPDKFKPERTMNHKTSIRDLMSNDHVNSFVFPDIKGHHSKVQDMSRFTGFTGGTNDEIPSQVGEHTIEYYL